MSDKFIDRVQELTDAICSGSAGWEQVGMLLVHLRPLVKRRVLLYDLTNFVPHGDTRDKGASHERIQQYIDNLITLAESRGGILVGPDPVFPRGAILDDLKAALADLGIKFDPQALDAREHELIHAIRKIVDDTTFTFKDERVAECKLEAASDGNVYFVFRLNGIDGNAIRGISPGIRFRTMFIE